MSPQITVVPSWLLKAKVSPPDPGAGSVPRHALLQRLGAAFERRFALLQAPAGFGKTTVLADFSRRKQEEGLVVAWVSLDEDDEPSLFGTYLTYAFECAGLDLSALNDPGAWSSSPVAYQVGMLARAIELHAAPCLLILDEVDRVPRETIAAIQRLVEHAPANLHFALAFRANPGLDLTMQVLDGSGVVLDADELRFSTSEIEQFFRGKLSPRRLTEVEEFTAGWPVALLIQRAERIDETGQPRVDTAKLTSNFFDLHLLRGLSTEERRFACELAVFDLIDTNLVDEVLGSGDARPRIDRLSPLDGLLSPIDETGAVRRLHPLVRNYFADLLAMEDPAGKRTLHAGIARALARRRQLIPALRHARYAGDPQLVGDLIEPAGVFNLWLRHGVTWLSSANEFLTPEVTGLYPRLLLLRSIVLRMALNVDLATAMYDSAARQTDGFTHDRAGGDAVTLAVDRVFASVVLAGGSRLAVHDQLDALLPVEGDAGGDEKSRLLLGARHMVLCGACYERGRLDDCQRHAKLARAYFGDERRYGNIIFDIYQGMAAMAAGSVQEAAQWYARARKGAKENFPTEACMAVCVDAVAMELDLERNRGRQIDQGALTGLAELRATWTDIDAIAISVSAELTFERQGREATIRMLRKSLEDVRAMRCEPLSKCVAGFLVFYLTEVGQADAAAQVWQDHALPDDVSELLDLESQPWRTMESMACARIRLLVAQSEFRAAEEVARQLCATASEHGLLRTRLQGLALSMLVAERAGQPDRALERLVEFLQLTRKVDYVRPLVRQREVSRVVLQRLLDMDIDAELRDAAQSMLSHLDRRPKTPVFSPRELQVLAEAREGRRNQEIADRLGISQPGVRYHLKKIYRKTGVSRRKEALRNAELMGALD